MLVRLLAMKERLRPIILVDDSPEDVELTSIVLRRGGIQNEIVVIKNGAKALTYFEHLARGQEARPALVLLDIMMPGVDGLEVLQYVREHSGLNDLPVIMLSGGDEEADLNICRQYGATAYLVKPLNISRFIQVADQMA